MALLVARLYAFQYTSPAACSLQQFRKPHHGARPLGADASEVSVASNCAIMFPTYCIVPLQARPVTSLPFNGPDIAHCRSFAPNLQALPNIERCYTNGR
mmetsp:Transcript_117/g.388  ORF Transcript_117/g.388 Transcript_117/m.388 type:complete len:99 (-) Transcript_117:221-517(-)